MAQVIWTEPALQELDEIADYSSLDNPKSAKNLVQEVFSKVKRLKRQPDSGNILQEIPDSIYQQMIVSPCRIFFRHEKESGRVFIIHILRFEQLLYLKTLKAR
ncbi:MAG: type II toxin-antitoxin system RelE/ParE family toxin [Balneolaceae bacterium]|nr:type II toxin-antitoxin system RelE/ParE family toxin [Balneolaceae bacterium]